ncbi:MAG: hypothetical protein NTW87_09940 [Planctomycetota bacterium]|nr:hypothetical protein [Planctomycetota bacterium]
MMAGAADGYYEFFPEELIPDGLRLVLDTWPILPRPDRDELENAITGRLAAHLKRAKKARRLPFSIHFQVTPLGPDGPLPARLDFKFLAGNDEDAYLAFECKRLRIPRDSGLDHNTSDYVGEEGMGRFISGKYAPGQFHGAMLGYVMDGNVVDAKENVASLIKKHSTRLCIESGGEWESSRFLPKEKDVHQTRHHLDKGAPTQRKLALQHIFLAV